MSWRGSPFMLKGARDSLPAAITSLAMLGVVMMGMLDRRWQERGVGRISLTSIWILIVYALGTYLTYAVGH